MEEIIKSVYEEVKRRCLLPSNEYGIGAWDHHIELVYKIVINIHKEYQSQIKSSTKTIT